MTQTCEVLPGTRWWTSELCRRKATRTIHGVRVCTYHANQIDAGIPQYARDLFHRLTTDGVRHDADRERRYQQHLERWQGRTGLR